MTMHWKNHFLLAILTSALATGKGRPQSLAPSTPVASSSTVPAGGPPVSISIYNRTRTDANQWYSAPPYTTVYPYVEQLLRISVAQRIQQIDWLLELSQNTVFDVPDDAISKAAAQGQLGLGGTYYAANNKSTTPAAASFKQGFARYHWEEPDDRVRVGRFEFLEGQEMQPKDKTLAWLQNNRVAQRLVGNFGFSNGQRSFDGVDGHYGQGSWDITAMAARADQGVFNMNTNPELNVDLQYLAYSKSDFGEHDLWRVFAMDYHDGRSGLTKTDNRPLAVRQMDHKNIRLGTYGADFLTAVPVGSGSLDLVFWGALQNGNWGALNQHAGAAAVEGGYRLTSVATRPWLRGGFFRSTGDNNPTDGQHNTFFQVLPTPRVYARFPFYNLMNSSDQFVQFIDSPKRFEIRSDLHSLQLTSKHDLWYQGGGAFDNKAFGYTGRPANGHHSFATVFDISSDYQLSKALAVNLYYAHSFGKSVVSTIYPTGPSANFGYLELVYRWSAPQRTGQSN
jgi:hypothetical protein